MEKIKRIPVIGYIVRLLVAILKLPVHVERIYEQNEEIDKLNQRCDDLTNKVKLLGNTIEELRSWNMDRMREIREINEWCEKATGLQASMQNGLEELRSWNMDRMKEIQTNNEVLKQILECQLEDSFYKKLNRRASLSMTVWGDEDRLHLSELASVGSCFMNVNSGHITIGDYTFAGSGVSILSGTHNPQFKGLLRRDAEQKEGCDIVIGNGVWLGSNCTILGPATIEDNAVIAAGAVVTPGTVIPKGTIYGGIPARKINDISFMDFEKLDRQVLNDIRDNYGSSLYVSGWKEKELRLYNDKEYWGHEIIDRSAMIYVLDDMLKVRCFVEQTEQVDFEIYIVNKKLGDYQCSSNGDIIEVPLLETSAEKNGFYIVKFKLKDNAKMFVSQFED